MTRTIVEAAGRDNVCSICGDESAADYKLASDQIVADVLSTLRLCDDCRKIRRELRSSRELMTGRRNTVQFLFLVSRALQASWTYTKMRSRPAHMNPHRIGFKRFERVVGYVCAFGEHYGNNALLSKIAKLHDHKGMLEVTWRVSPTDGEKEILAKAWRSLIGDGAAKNVEHQEHV